jgi:hypothetical protein
MVSVDFFMVKRDSRTNLIVGISKQEAIPVI